MSGISEINVLAALGAFVLLGAIVAWWAFRRAVSLVWQVVTTVVSLVVLGVGGVAAYVAYSIFTDTPLPFGLSLLVDPAAAEAAPPPPAPEPAQPTQPTAPAAPPNPTP